MKQRYNKSEYTGAALYTLAGGHLVSLQDPEAVPVADAVEVPTLEGHLVGIHKLTPADPEAAPKYVIALSPEEGKPLVGVVLTHPEGDIQVITALGKAIEAGVVSAKELYRVEALGDALTLCAFDTATYPKAYLHLPAPAVPIGLIFIDTYVNEINALLSAF